MQTGVRRSNHWAKILLLLVLPALTHCVSHRHQPFDSARQYSYTMPANTPRNAFDYQAPPPQVETYAIPTRTLDGYDISGIRFPSSERNGQEGNLVSAKYYRSKKPTIDPKPLLIVLPIWATHSFPSTILTQGYGLHSKGAVNLLWMDGNEPLFDWFSLRKHQSEKSFEEEVDLSVERYRAVTIDTRRLIDWAETRPEIDSRRIAIAGFSMSAIVAANVAGTDSRIHTAVFVLGGAQPWEIMSECGVIVGYMRNRIKKNLGWDQEQFRNFFQTKLEAGDPANWHGRYRSENILIVEASKDDCMPAQSRDALWHATGQPERTIFPYNHWQPFLAMTPIGGEVMSEDIFNFLDRKLLSNSLPAERFSGKFCAVDS